MGHNRLHESDSTSNPRVYEKILSETSQIQFQEGDVVRVYTPLAPRLSFQHQRGGGEAGHYRAAIDQQLSTLNTNDIIVYTNTDVQLLTIETTPPGCISGLIDRDTLLLKAGQHASDVGPDITFREATQRLMPEVVFPCAGVVTKFTLAAQSQSSGSFPELQVWRKSGENAWFKVHSVSSEAAVVRGNSLNVHDYILPSVLALHVEWGDVLGLYQPYSLVAD